MCGRWDEQLTARTNEVWCGRAEVGMSRGRDGWMTTHPLVPVHDSVMTALGYAERLVRALRHVARALGVLGCSHAWCDVHACGDLMGVSCWAGWGPHTGQLGSAGMGSPPSNDWP